jgi:hypothetical protein
VVWDFSSLEGIEEELVELMAPASLPSGSAFPLANVVGNDPFALLFQRGQADGLWLLGRDVFGDVIPFDDHKLELPFPCTFGTEWADDFHAFYTIENDDFELEGTINGVADAHGTLLMPCGTVNNVLRVHAVEVSADIFEGEASYSVLETFSWYTPGTPWPLVQHCQLVFEFFGEPIEIAFTTWSAPLVAGIADQQAELRALKAYPNPAVGTVAIALPEGEDLALAIHNMQGQLVHAQQGLAGGRELRVDLEGLAPGVYLASTQDRAGQGGMVRILVQ